MKLNEVLARVDAGLNGRAATEEEIAFLKDSIPNQLLPEWFSRMIHAHRLIGCRISINEQDDQSGIGVEMLWLAPDQMLAELTESEPGRSVCSQGFLPVGACATGSGDPYFLDLRDVSMSDPPVVRIRHDLAGMGEYPLEDLELVAPALSRFLLQAVCI